MSPHLVSLTAALASSLAAAPPPPYRFACLRIAPDAQLEALALHGAAAAPIELRVAQAPPGKTSECWTMDQLPRAQLPAVGRRAPGPLRIARADALRWREPLRALFGEKDSTRFADALAPRLSLPGTGGDLAVVPRPRRDAVPDSARVFLTVGARSVSVTLAAAELWELGWAVTEKARALEPGLRIDPDTTFEAPGVDRPPRLLRASRCSGPFRHSAWFRPNAQALAVTFVVGKDGRVEGESIEFTRYHVRDGAPRKEYELDALACLGALRFQPAEVRGQPVRMIMRHEIIVT